MVTPLAIVAAAAACYTAVETGIYMFKHREVDLPKRKAEDPSITMHGSYFNYLFRDSCGKCDREDYNRKLSRSYRTFLPIDYEVRHDCTGHPVYGCSLWDDDEFPEGFDKDRLEGGSRLSLRRFTEKLSNFAYLAFSDFKEALFKPKEVKYAPTLRRIFSDESLDDMPQRQPIQRTYSSDSLSGGYRY